ncbi:MAG: FAD/NAD(P)-binding protein [Actinomycetota bacterium]|nr:FAD/NAD(P)-binding protein [Actinomycetota bacterium]
MAGKKAVIVEAGLSGLCAAITARKMGYDVHCVDKYNRVGGMPEARPFVDSTPFDCELMSRFLGVRIGESQVRPCENFHVYTFGKLNKLRPEYSILHDVERGHRKTAIDRYLHDMALDMGVTFEWGNPIESQKDLTQYPPDTIVSTGPYREAFDVLCLPYETAYGYVMRKIYRQKGERCLASRVSVYFDHYTKDYCYLPASNGVVPGLFFAHRPVGEERHSVWAGQLKENEGVEFKTWHMEKGYFASRYPNSPRLFAADKILAVTLAGTQDPGTYFGCHCATVSGKIATIALEDKETAQEMFDYCLRSYNRMWLTRRVGINCSPDFMRGMALGRGVGMVAGSDFMGRLQGVNLANMIPGYLLIRKNMVKFTRYINI